MTSVPNTHTFIADDFCIKDYEYDNPIRYVFTSSIKAGDLNASDYDIDIYESFDQWAEDNLSYEELYQVPMMNALYYFPSFVSFSEEDRYKCSSNTTLVYDSQLDSWAVGMTGGGMDLSPHLLDTYIKLGKGIPTNIARAIGTDYSAYINQETHLTNCKSLAKAFLEECKRNKGYAERLRTSV